MLSAEAPQTRRGPPADDPEGPAAIAGVLQPLVETVGLSRIYRLGRAHVHALRDVFLRIGTGERVAIVGPSGSGKSTLLGILGGLESPSTGIYRLDGVDVAALSRRDLARLRNERVGFVFQSFHLLGRMRAWENVALPLFYAGLPGREARALALRALARVGLEARGDHRPGELSGGEQQRVAIARAIVRRPALLLADEPTGNLDSATGRAILDSFDALHAEGGMTLILVTHDREIAARMPRIIRLRDGRVESDSGMKAATS